MWTALCSDKVINYSLIMRDRTLRLTVEWRYGFLLFRNPSNNQDWGQSVKPAYPSLSSEFPRVRQVTAVPGP